VQASIKVDEGGLSKRDYIPLAIALFVDICLLLVSIGRPMNRFNGLIPKMRAAERGPVYQILSRFDDIHRDDNQEVLQKFEVFRHVVFDFHGDYYVAVPLDAPSDATDDKRKRLQQEAHLLGNLFASFEKEKIFSRVYNPMLTRRVIQKKLARQGSKFSQSQAFRIYRFRDGAWSEIILGAVMGAARDLPPKPKKLTQPTVLSEQRAEDVEVEYRPLEASPVDRVRTSEPEHSPLYHPLEPDVATIGDSEEQQQQEYIDPEKTKRQFGAYASHVMRPLDPTPNVQTAPSQRQPEERSDMRFDGSSFGDQEFGAQDQHFDPLNGAAEHSSTEPHPNNVLSMKAHLNPERGHGSVREGGQAADFALNDAYPLEEILAFHSDQASSDHDADFEQTRPVVSAPEEIALQPVAEPDLGENVNVRITERTADFTMPRSAAPSLPHELLNMAEHAQAEQSYSDPVHSEEPLPVMVEDDSDPIDQRADYLNDTQIGIDDRAHDMDYFDTTEIEDNATKIASRFARNGQASD